MGKINTGSRNLQLFRSIFLYGTFLYVIINLLAYSLATYNLDEIKNVILLIVSPIFLVGYFAANLYLLSKNEKPLYYGIPKYVVYTFLSYFLVMIISSLFSKYHWVNVMWMTYQISYFAIFVFFASAFNNQTESKNTMLIFASVALYICVLGLLPYYRYTHFLISGNRNLQGRAFAQLFQQLEYSGDLMSTIFNRDFFANFIVTMLPIAVTLFLTAKNQLYKIFAVITFVVLAICIYISKSKDTFLSLVIALCVYGIIVFKIYGGWNVIKGNIKYKIFILVVLLTVMTIVLSVFMYLSKPQNQIYIKESVRNSWLSRVYIWDSAVKIFKEFPVLGGGPGSFRIYYPKFRDPDYFEHGISNVTVYAHNEYLEILADTGILGLGAFLIFLSAAFFTTYKILKSTTDKKMKLYAAGIGCALLTCLIAGFFSPYIRWTVGAVFLWALIGIVVGQYKIIFPEDTSYFGRINFGRQKQVLIILLILSTLFAGYSVKLGANWFITAVHYCKGMQYLETKQKNYNAASEEFKTAIDHTPVFLSSYYKLAHCYSQMQELQKALDTYLILASYFPDYSDIHFNLGSLYYRLGDREKSIKELLIHDKMNNQIQIKHAIARQLLAQNDYKDGEMVLDEILAQDKNNIAATKLLVTTLFKEGKMDKLKDTLINYLKVKPDDSTYRIALLEVFKKLYGGEAGLFEYLNKEVAANPKDLGLRKVLAMFYIDSKNNSAALKHLEYIITIVPKDTFALSHLADIYMQLGDKNKAAEYYNQIKK